jgi:hypothetical protein
MDSAASALRILTGVLAELQIPYLIGGSVASSALGVLRATMDVDLLVRLPAADAARLAEALGPDWYADPDAMRDALMRGRPFNVIHQATGEKFDFFPARAEFHEEELKRAKMMDLRLGEETLRLPVASLEDIILAKLQWYRAGGEVSERQWSDVQNLLTFNVEFDGEYLATWARRLGVQDLLARATAQAGFQQ